jgi:hypothetical protein
MRPLEELRPRLHKKATQRKTDRQDELGALLFLILVVPEADEFDVPHMARSRPFEKFELADGLGLHPDAFLHLCRGQPLSPSAGRRLGQICERTFPDHQPLQIRVQ